MALSCCLLIHLIIIFLLRIVEQYQFKCLQKEKNIFSWRTTVRWYDVFKSCFCLLFIWSNDNLFFNTRINEFNKIRIGKAHYNIFSHPYLVKGEISGWSAVRFARTVYKKSVRGHHLQKSSILWLKLNKKLIKLWMLLVFPAR